MWFILISSWGCVCSHFIFSKRGHIDWPIANFLGALGTAHRSTLLFGLPIAKWNKCAPCGPPFTFIYMRVELWANHMGYKWGAIGNILVNYLRTWRTLWELHGMATPQKKKERTGPLIRSHLEVAGSDNTPTCHHNSPHWERPIHHSCLTEENLKTSHNKECITLRPCDLH